jgi:hypothetical protein
MGADRTLMQVKVRCGLGRVGVLGRLYGNKPWDVRVNRYRNGWLTPCLLSPR